MYISLLEAPGTRVGNHRAVVGAEFQPRIKDLRANVGALRGQPFAEQAVGPDTPRHDKTVVTGIPDSAETLDNERIDGSILECPGYVGHRLFVPF